MAFPRIIFNATTGNDGYSGAGPGDGTTSGSVLTGSDGSFSGTTVTLPNADLSNVLTDGSHALTLVVTSGRRFFKITGKADSGTATANVTVADAPAGTSTGRTYALGGKRATFNHADSRLLWTQGTTFNLRPGWSVYSETDQALTSSGIVAAAGLSGDTTDGPIVVELASGAILSQSANANHWTLGSGRNFWEFRGGKYTNSNGTKSSAIAFNLTGNAAIIENVEMGDATNALGYGIMRNTAGTTATLRNCLIHHCTIGASNTVSGNATSTDIQHCGIYDNAGPLSIGNNSSVEDSFIVRSAGKGILLVTSTFLIFRVARSVIHANAGDGIDLSAGVLSAEFHLLSNQITGNNTAAGSNYGIRCDAGQNLFAREVGYNNFHGNVSGNDRLNLSAATGDIAVDPGYRNASGSDFADFLGGAAQRGTGWPLYTDIGLPQPSSGGILRHPGMCGGLSA